MLLLNELEALAMACPVAPMEIARSTMRARVETWVCQRHAPWTVGFSHVDRNRAPWTAPWTVGFSHVDAVDRRF